MSEMSTFERFVGAALTKSTKNGPAHLRKAIFYAVFPGGGRVRPKLGFGITEAMGSVPDDAIFGGAAAIEMIHCASLVHDDLPCFDDADMRRNKPSVHVEFGEDTAVLAGDALIAGAFGVIAEHTNHRPELTGELIRILAEAVGASKGIIAGQASEADPGTQVERLHEMKTGALFEAVAAMAAVVNYADPAPWRTVGKRLGQAYQIADDILDKAGSPESAGKPVLQDNRNQKPNLLRSASLADAALTLDALVNTAAAEIPPCPGKEKLANMLTDIASRLCPPALVPRTPNSQSKHLKTAGGEIAVGMEVG